MLQLYLLYFNIINMGRGPRRIFNSDFIEIITYLYIWFTLSLWFKEHKYSRVSPPDFVLLPQLVSSNIPLNSRILFLVINPLTLSFPLLLFLTQTTSSTNGIFRRLRAQAGNLELECSTAHGQPRPARSVSQAVNPAMGDTGKGVFKYCSPIRQRHISNIFVTFYESFSKINKKYICTRESV